MERDNNTLPYEHHPEDRKESMPEKIGPYRILKFLGKGGMGTVYLAEQVVPVRRMVALKLVNIGLGTEGILARFKRETQALALMNHPNIASVYDAGSSEDGVPYFAMEFVEGEPIVSFCDSRHYNNRERLELFLQVCDAIQHAHQKMVIHRDLKPSNILVADRDGKPVPKVIDFGIAKDTGNPLMEMADLTRSGSPIGTPMYMAPEQIEDRGFGIDARVDVYALGILLYELVAGALPFGSAEQNAVLLMAKVVEQDPETPSTKLTSLGETQIEIAQRRGTNTKSLKAQLRGELDWIVMRAIEKNRDKRYGSVAELRADVMHFLCDEPVSAMPPTFLYRAQKFVKRHTAAVVAGVVVVLALVLGISGTTMGMVRADRARAAAEASEKKARSTVEYLQKILSSSDPNMEGRAVRVVDLLERASQIISNDLSDQPEIEASVRKTLGWTFLELGMYDESERELLKTCDIQKKVLGDNHPETLNSVNALGRVYYKKGRYAEAEKIHRMVLEQEKKIQGVRHPTTLWTMYNLAKALDRQGELEEAEDLYRMNLSIRISVLGPEHPNTLVTVNSLSLLLGYRGKVREAEHLQRNNLEVLERVLGPDHLNTLNAGSNLVQLLNFEEKYREAESLARETLQKQTTILGPNHPETLSTRNRLAFALQHLGELEEAERLLRQVLEKQKEVLGTNHPDTLDTQLQLANSLFLQGNFTEALALLEQGRSLAGENLSEDHWQSLLYKGYYGRCLYRLGDLDKAQPLLYESFEALGRRFRPQKRELLASLVSLLEQRGEKREAERYRQLFEY